jgi:hypothetical protein
MGNPVSLGFLELSALLLVTVCMVTLNRIWPTHRRFHFPVP